MDTTQTPTATRTFHCIHDGVRTLAKECQRGYVAVLVAGQWTLKSQADPQLVLLGDRDMAEAQKRQDGSLAAKICGY